MTDRQKEIVDFLETLTHTLTTFKHLEEQIKKFFNKDDVEFHYSTEEELLRGDEPSQWDYRLMFNVQNDDENYGFYDIYYLPTLKPSELDGSNIYITGVGYWFQD